MSDLQGSDAADRWYRLTVATMLGAGEAVGIMQHRLAVRSISIEGERLEAAPDRLWRAVVESGVALERAIEELLGSADADLGERVALLTGHVRDRADDWLLEQVGVEAREPEPGIGASVARIRPLVALAPAPPVGSGPVDAA